ncbi:MAG: site-specific integrase [Planctomycetales bacterium]|nr:site-specific integrase [Planctomycetales bacterium]
MDKPKVVRKTVSPLEPDQCHDLFAASESHRIGDIVILAAMTGLRKGELFALQWNAVNLDECVLVVRKTLQELHGVSVKENRGRTLKEPKTAAGRRVIPLGKGAVEALRNRLAKAEAEGFDTQQVETVFPNIRGGFLLGLNFDRNVWHPIRHAAGIPASLVFHDLRHTQASLMLAAGVDLKVIQKRLGHRDFLTTANTYSHLLANAQTDAVDKLETRMRKQAPKRSKRVS